MYCFRYYLQNVANLWSVCHTSYIIYSLPYILQIAVGRAVSFVNQSHRVCLISRCILVRYQQNMLPSFAEITAALNLDGSHDSIPLSTPSITNVADRNVQIKAHEISFQKKKLKTSRKSVERFERLFHKGTFKTPRAPTSKSNFGAMESR